MVRLNYKSGEMYGHVEMYCHLVANEIMWETFSRVGCKITDEGDSVTIEIPNEKVQTVVDVLQDKVRDLMDKAPLDIHQNVNALREDPYIFAQQAVLYSSLRLDILNEWCNIME